MATHPFLSDEWLAEARTIRAEFSGSAQPAATSVRMNLVITGVPFGPGSVDAHLDTSSGEMDLDVGHIDPADLKVTLDYEIAKAILIEGNPQAGMQAFMSGKIKVEGDMAKLMQLQNSSPDAAAADMAARIKAVTE